MLKRYLTILATAEGVAALPAVRRQSRHILLRGE
jgi:hypothetical protein